MEESYKFLEHIKKYLSEKSLKSALELIKDNKNNVETCNILSDVIPYLITQLTARCENHVYAETFLNAFADEYDPEEMLFQLIDDIDKLVDDEKLLVLVDVLLRVLLRLPPKRLNSLGWGLNAVLSYVSKVSLPENVNLNEDEEILMDADPVVDRVSYLCSSLLPFFRSLIESCPCDDAEKKIVVLKFTLLLLGKPLALLDLKSSKTTSKARRAAEGVVELIVQLHPDVFSLLELQPSHDIGRMDVLALATLFYLVLSENVECAKLPKIYDNVYVFQQSIPLLTVLFNCDSQFVQHNGLSLTQASINRVAKDTLSYLLLDSEHHSHFCKALTHVIVYSHLETHRKKALDLYKHYLFLFDDKGRYLLIYNLMKILNHTGIIGFTITQYKDMLVAELNKQETSIYFTSGNLYSILDRFCLLPNQEESDLLELADQIVAALNLLRYLIIRDNKNITGITYYLKRLEQKYLDPLQKALELSRAHYKVKIKDVKAESAEGDRGDSKVSVTVAGQTLSEMPANEKIMFLCSALTTFDVIENLQCRVNELIKAM